VPLFRPQEVHAKKHNHHVGKRQTRFDEGKSEPKRRVGDTDRSLLGAQTLPNRGTGSQKVSNNRLGLATLGKRTLSLLLQLTSNPTNVRADARHCFNDGALTCTGLQPDPAR
jgi:hypothetical protein